MTKFQKIICLLLVVGVAVGGAGFVILNRNIGDLKLKNYSYNDFDPFVSVEYELREPDAEAFQVTLAVTAYPHEYTKTSTVRLLYKDQVVPMELNNLAFTGEIAVPLVADIREIKYLVLLETNGLIRSHSTGVDFGRLASGAAVFGYQPEDKTEDEEENARYQMDTALEFDESLLPFVDQAVSARVYAQNSAEEELFSEKMKGNALQLNQEISIDADEKITLYGEVQGKSGMIYNYSICRFVRVDDGDVLTDTYFPEKLRIIGTRGQEAELNY